MNPRIPARFRSDVVRQIGHGGEATVYELSDGRVLRVFHKIPDLTIAKYIAPFYERLAKYDLPFEVPRILEFGTEDGVGFSLDNRIQGRAFHDVLPELTGADRARALDSYTDAASALSIISLPEQPYGEFLFEEALQSETWRGFLIARLEANYERGRPDLIAAIPEVETIVDDLRSRIRMLADPRKVLVHGDYFPGNVLMDDAFNVTGVIDFGWLTVAGDAAMDLASAEIFLDVVRGHQATDAEHVRARLLGVVHGEELAPAIEVYRGWYAVRFSPYKEDDDSLFEWCVRSLERLRDA